MNDDPNDSLTSWLGRLRDGSDAAVQSLHRYVFDTLVGVARRKLNGRELRWADEEDVALSAFHSFCARAAQGGFPALKQRHEVRNLLITMTSRKAGAYLRYHDRQRRGGRKVGGESVLFKPDRSSGGLDNMPGKDETPELAVVIAEECQRLLERLGDDSLSQIAIWKMEGHTDAEIAKKLGVVTRTVERKIARIRAKWEGEGRS